MIQLEQLVIQTHYQMEHILGHLRLYSRLDSMDLRTMHLLTELNNRLLVPVETLVGTIYNSVPVGSLSPSQTIPISD